MNCLLPPASFFVTHEKPSSGRIISFAPAIKEEWKESKGTGGGVCLKFSLWTHPHTHQKQVGTQYVTHISGCVHASWIWKGFEQGEGGVSELPPKQAVLDGAFPAHWSTQNKLCIVLKDINKRLFNFHASPCNAISILSFTYVSGNTLC